MGFFARKIARNDLFSYGNTGLLVHSELMANFLKLSLKELFNEIYYLIIVILSSYWMRVNLLKVRLLLCNISCLLYHKLQ